MSTSNQTNGKKINSTNNSMTNTPSSTPVSTITNSVNTQAPIQSTTPPNNAPKYGTLVPNRIFVGGISANTTEAELLQLFSNYGTVKAAKIIQDRAGVSKGYGFVTFETEEDAKRLQREADNIVLRERKLNIAPAIKKQPFSRAFDASSPPTITPGAQAPYFIPAGGMPFYQSGMTYYSQAPPSGDPNAQQPPVYQPPPVYPAQSGPPQTAAYPSIVYPTQPLYMPQQFPYQPVPYDYGYYTNGGPQYMVGNQNTSQPQGHSMQPPGSPPRTPCYNPPLPYPEAMYFNMPMFGGPVETTAIYQESLDMANGNINEDSYGYFGISSIELEPRPSSSNTNNMQESSTSVTSDMSRQSNTPVVSVLSLDQHQERDFTSLQSGRRRRSVETTATLNNMHEYSKHVVVVTYENSVLNRNQQSQSRTTLQSVSTQACLSNGFGGPRYSSYPYNGSLNGNDRSTWYNRRRNRYADEQHSQTESNSTTSVDENRNEEINRTNNTPPPAPYSPTTQTQYGIHTNKYNSRNFHNSARSTRGDLHNVNSNNNFRYNTFGANKTMHRNPVSQIRKSNFHIGGRNYYNNPKKHDDSNSLVSNVKDKPVETSTKVKVNESETVNNSSAKNPSDVCNKSSDTPNVSAGNSTLVSLEHAVANGLDLNLNSIPSQIPSSIASMSFTPPARRGGRRSMRRAPTGSSTSEIGAGDAPLPPSTTDVADACKMLDNLKL